MSYFLDTDVVIFNKFTKKNDMMLNLVVGIVCVISAFIALMGQITLCSCLGIICFPLTKVY